MVSGWFLFYFWTLNRYKVVEPDSASFRALSLLLLWLGVSSFKNSWTQLNVLEKRFTNTSMSLWIFPDDIACRLRGVQLTWRTSTRRVLPTCSNIHYSFYAFKSVFNCFTQFPRQLDRSKSNLMSSLLCIALSHICMCLANRHSAIWSWTGFAYSTCVLYTIPSRQQPCFVGIYVWGTLVWKSRNSRSWLISPLSL